MAWRTAASLVGAVAFGIAMAAITPASGAINRGGGLTEGRCPTRDEAMCMASCAPTGSSAEQVSRCATQCNYPDKLPPDPLDCQYFQRPARAVAPNIANRATHMLRAHP